MVYAGVPLRQYITINLIKANDCVELRIVLLSVELFDEALQAGIVYVHSFVVRSQSSIDIEHAAVLAKSYDVVAKVTLLNWTLFFWRLRLLLLHLLRYLLLFRQDLARRRLTTLRLVCLVQIIRQMLILFL